MMKTIKHEEYTYHRRRVVLDTTEIYPGVFETMLLRSSDGEEIACMTADTEAEALAQFASIRAALSLPRWSAEKVKQAAKEAGTT